MPNDQAHDTRTTNPANRLAQAVSLSVASRPAGEPDEPVQDGDGTLLFYENFNNQPDWQPELNGGQTQFRWDGDVLPAGWDAVFDGSKWYPANGNIRILASDTDKAYGGSGKSLVCFRENHYNEDFSQQYNSNGDLGKLLDTGVDDIYVEFLISFQPGWTSNDNRNKDSKIFRVFSSSGATSEFWQAFPNGEQGPLFLWFWSESESYGTRNKLAFRGGPIGENYYPDSDFATGLGRGTSGGDVSLNWSDDLQGNLADGSSPQVPDQENGGFLPTIGTVWHPQIFGPGSTWNKMAFRLKMNSAPGAKDGILQQFFNDQLIVDSYDVMWVGPTTSPMVKWNGIAFGGNDYWSGGMWSNADEREEWYAIDEVKVFNGLPEGLI